MCINKNTAIKIFFTDIKQLKMILTLSIWSGTIYPFYFCYCCQCFFDLFCVIALGVEPPTKFSKKSGGAGWGGGGEGLDRISIFGGRLLRIRGWVFSGVVGGVAFFT